MSRTSQALKRLGVSAVCAVTVFGVAPAFTAPAQANHTTTAITLSPDAQTSPEDTCQQYTATVTFNNTTGTDTATIDVVADPRALEDVEFCALSGTNNGTSTNLNPQAPNAQTAPQTTAFPANNTNGTTTTFISGGGPGITENREFTVISAAGSNTASVTFGVVSDRVGTVDITAFLENVGNNSGDGVKQAGELGETSVGTFTQGGTEGVERVDAEPETGAATQQQAYTFTAQVFDAGNGGRPIAGVIPEFVVISGPDVPANGLSTPCNALTDQNGTTTCTLQNGGVTPGTDTIRVFVDQDNPDNNVATPDARDNRFDAGEPFDDITVVFSSPQAAGTTVTLTCGSVRTNLQGDACDNPVTENTEVFTALVRNAAAQPLSGVPVRFTIANSGGNDANNVPAGTNDTETITAQCTTGADGTCSSTLTNPRVSGGAVGGTGEQFTVTAAVEVSSGSGNCPGINDVANNSVCDSATKRFRTPAATEARTLTLNPDTQTVPAQGGVARVTATVVDRSGIAIPNFTVFFTEEGTGRFFNGFGANQAACTTATNGQCSVELSTTTAEGAGSTTVTGTLRQTSTPTNDEECEQTVNNTGQDRTFDGNGNQTSSVNRAGNNQPGAPAGDCDDTAVVNFGAPATTPASPPASTPATTPASPPASTPATTPASTPPSSPAATSSPAAPTTKLTLTVTGPGTITPGQQGILRGTGQANQAVVLRCYSRPSIEYYDARSTELGEDGTVEFRITPGTNTRCFLKYLNTADNDARNSASVVQNVATALSLSVRRLGVRNYIFEGRILPRRAGQLITLYRVDSTGREVLTAQVKTDSTGTWRIPRVFTGSGTFNFIARTGQTLTNVAGRSNVRPTAIF